MQNKFMLVNNLLNDLVSQARESAFEEAIKATCKHCARQLPAELVTIAQCPPIAEIGDYDNEDGPIYIHRRDNKELFANFLCDATGIHALKDSRTTRDSDAGKLFLNTSIPAVGQNLYIDPNAPTDNWESILKGDAEE